MDKEQVQMLASVNLKSFKKRMKIFGASEDEYLISLLASSFSAIEVLIGPYDKEDDLNFIELVYERSRYAYNDSLEYFSDNFQTMILDLSLDVAGDVDETEL